MTRFSLQKIIGPDCPSCGCNGAKPIDCKRRKMHVWTLFLCDNCGHQFPITGEAVEPQRVPECRYCGSNNSVATSTPGRVQYRRCRDCGNNFSAGFD